MSSLNKMMELVAAINEAHIANGGLKDTIKDNNETISQMVRDTAKECHAEGMDAMQGYAAFIGYTAQQAALNPNGPKINKIYSTGIRGYIAMLEAKVDIERYTNKGKPAAIQEAVSFVASDEVKRIQAAKTRINEVIKGLRNADKAVEAKALEALAADIEALVTDESEQDAPVQQAANG